VDYGFCDTTLHVPDGFTEVLWSTGDTLNDLVVSQSGMYYVQAKDLFGRMQYDSIMVSFLGVEIPTVSSFCAGDNFVWDTELPAFGYAFNWYNSDSETPVGVYSTEAFAAVEITDSLGCVYRSDTIWISEDNFAETASLGDGDTSLCIGNVLVPLNAEDAVTYLWQDGSTEPEYIIAAAGTYTLEMHNSIGCVATDTLEVSILGTAPTASFTVTGQCAESEILLEDASSSVDGVITAWEWIYDGNVISTSNNASLVFDAAGNYDVSLEIFTDAGCHQIVTQAVEIEPLPLPDFIPLRACSGQEIEFENRSSISSGMIDSYRWKVSETAAWQSSDGNISTVYDVAGDYRVSLEASSSAGCISEIEKAVHVYSTPLADFSTNSACEEDTVLFWNQSEATDDNPLWSYYWDFGDGNNSTESDPIHLYAETGSYDVELVVQSLNGCRDTLFQTVIVNSNPTAFAGNLDACQNTVHQLMDESSVEIGEITEWLWNVGGMQYTSQNPEVYFADTGQIAFQLRVFSSAGCFAEFDSIIHVWENPIAEFSLPASWGAAPFNGRLENESEDAVAWFWNFGDGNTSVEENPIHVWQDSGQYLITLIVESERGCIDTAQNQLKVIVPRVDVAVLGVRSLMNGNYLYVEADIVNPGTIPIEDLVLELDVDNYGEIIREILPGEFAAGGVMRYVFSTQVFIPDGNLPEYVCVSVDSGMEDLTPENNRQCQLNNAGFRLTEMYPNPVTDILYLDLLIPENGDLELYIFNMNGKIVKSINEVATAGYYHLSLDCQDLVPGKYEIRIHFAGENIQRSFVK
jgi:PKD repeat protein